MRNMLELRIDFPLSTASLAVSHLTLVPWGNGMACQVSGVEFDREGVAAHAKNLANKVKGGLEVIGTYITIRLSRWMTVISCNNSYGLCWKPQCRKRSRLCIIMWMIALVTTTRL